ncbi:unnamed protein product [Phyllotreta striolata]|uniref:Uncharacterized protein n=1 Tax=Phyllotreta striolata TaxID=444603 RepID=A0A9N9XJG6_PHYSR|nr:unnamed protein product [Phyllotreta striolata]
MLLRWSFFLLIFVLFDNNEIRGSRSYTPSRGSSSGSRSTGSRSPSYGSSSYRTSRPSASHGSFGWHTTSRPRYTTRRTQHYHITTMPTHRTTRRYYMTTMPTHRTTKHHYMTTMPTHRTTKHHYMTTMPTHRTTKHHYITTMPTQRTTKHPYVTTMPTHKITKQPPYNPFFSSTIKPNHAGSHLTTKQPAYNPFFSTTKVTHNNLQQGSWNGHKNTTRQPAHNPFFSTTTKQPPYNPFFSSTTHRPFGNTSNNHHQTSGIWGSTKTTSKPSHYFNRTQTIRPLQNGIHNGGNQHGSGHNGGGSNGKWNNTRPTEPHRPPVTQKPIVTHRPWGPSFSGHNTTNHKFTKPSWNNSHTGISSSIHRPVYQPPGAIVNPHVNRPSYITGSHPNPTSPTHHTTVINNNNYHYHPGAGYYHPSTGSVSHVTVINNNHYVPNYHHRVIIPSHHYYSYGPPAVGITILDSDYYHYHPLSSHYVTTYHYTPVHTGSTSLGFFLGYQLGRISRPSYYYHSTSYVNNEYVPRYDHYDIHHYYHNSQSVPKEAPIQPNAIVVCAGDSSQLCPSGNMPLCTNNGAVMCVVSAQSTEPCADNKENSCAKGTINCQGNNSPECKQQNQATISIPCVSTAKIAAGVNLVNNSLIVTDPNDSSTKNFCVTILALPAQSKNATVSGKLAKAPTPIEFSLPFRYTTNDTGVSLLGYYLGEKLQNLIEPSYSFLNYDENYTYIEKFNHYNVFHYDHDATVLPNIVDIKSDQIMSCAGDSGTFCPQNTTSVCLYDGAVICVTELNSTIVNNESKVNYIRSNISCSNLRSPACTMSAQNSTITIDIPCISTARLYAKSSYLIKTYGTGASSINYKTLTPVLNGTTVEALESPRELCVTVLALPGERAIVKSPKVRKVSGIPNAPHSLRLPRYTYTTADASKDAYGNELIKRLNNIYYPTYYWINAYLYQTNGEVQKYDHYSLHYYNHSDEIIPNDVQIQATDISGCSGDTGILCSQKGSSSLCTTDGTVWCVTDQLLTDICPKRNNSACVKTAIPKKIVLGCISTLTVTGDVLAVNDTIYTKKVSESRSYVDIQPMPGNYNNTSKAQHFCVTLVGIPIERNITTGEKLFDNSDSLFGMIASKIFG